MIASRTPHTRRLLQAQHSAQQGNRKQMANQNGPMVIEVGAYPLDIRKVPAGINQKGKAYDAFDVRTQIAYLHIPGAAPRELRIRLSRDQQPHAAGRYTLDLSSFYIEDGQLRVKQELVLVPLAAPAAARQSA